MNLQNDMIPHILHSTSLDYLVVNATWNISMRFYNPLCYFSLGWTTFSIMYFNGIMSNLLIRELKSKITRDEHILTFLCIFEINFFIKFCTFILSTLKIVGQHLNSLQSWIIKSRSRQALVVPRGHSECLMHIHWQWQIGLISLNSTGSWPAWWCRKYGQRSTTILL